MILKSPKLYKSYLSLMVICELVKWPRFLSFAQTLCSHFAFRTLFDNNFKELILKVKLIACDTPECEVILDTKAAIKTIVKSVTLVIW